ncbi:hypothetical protein Csa_003628 [Cucumis sativus]|uniref:Uncharacterized protein n=1 Tax=Cucumis sativus TaxID=3659 RepID=A0A0A0KH43_CUCSA|nr:hypothetical protein Csa_003628 [Cucumis sativus]
MSCQQVSQDSVSLLHFLAFSTNLLKNENMPFSSQDDTTAVQRNRENPSLISNPCFRVFIPRSSKSTSLIQWRSTKRSYIFTSTFQDMF